MFKRFFVVTLFLALVFGGIFGWKYTLMQRMAATGPAAPPPAVIAADTVRTTTWQPRLSTIGSVVATQGVLVSNEIAGQVREIAFVSGHPVAAGEVLVQLDDAVDQADLASLMAAQHLARLEFERAEKLLREKTLSQSNYDQARSALDGATAAVSAQRARIRRKAIRAPFAGVLGIRQVDLGQYLAPGTPIVSLQALAAVYADFTLPERYLSDLAVDQPVEITVQAYPERRFSGAVQAISSRLETGTRSVPVRAIFDNTERLLRPGMFADVSVLLPVRDAVLTLSAMAVTYNPYGESVFVIEQTEAGLTAQRRQVETGDVRDGRVEIIAGLAAGDQVVSAGHNKLRSGQSVVVDNSVELSGHLGTP